MAETPETAPQRDVAKYVFTALALAVLALGLWVVFVFSADDGPRISFRTLAVQVGDPERVVVTFEVTKDPALTAECQVTATGDDREIVNRLTGIRIPAGTERTTRHTVTVRTDQAATDATVTYCAITGGP
jgi:hypothetical protein